MSHEIRTPLNAIVGFSEQLSHASMKDEDQRKMTIIQKSAEHLTQITNDILDFSRINAGSIQLETIPVSIREEAAFLEESMGEMAQRNDNKLRVEIDEDVPAYVLGDALRIRQILFNLLSNAMKFTKNGTVKLSIKPSQQTATQLKLVFAVADTGIGISEENIGRIFDEFEQAETSTTRNYGGTGLGLSITRNLVQLMNGELQVKSEPDKGTTFSFTVPFTIADAPEKEAAAEPAQNLSFLHGKRILIVDDELYNRKLLRNMLQAWDTVITECADGEEALQEVSGNEYDLVLLDLRMPKMDGFQTRKAIQQLGPEKAAIPVIALTAALTHEERVSMLEDQWKGVLLKPLKVKDLAQCLQPLFNSEAAPAPALNGVNGHKAEQETALNGDEVISLEPLREISGNDRKFYLDMLKTFLRTTRDGIDAINQTSKIKDWEGMAEAAHKIASPVRHVQANEVYEMLKQLEREGRANTIGQSINQQITQLNQSVDRILQIIDREIERVE
jgi:CheY-like chemotaxis protein/HPt (histidine-containing phosphotransfer) domain-containing protein